MGHFITDPKMTEIIEESYRLFSKYKAIRPLDVCTEEGCCMKIEDEGLLANLPVREIPKELLRIYNDGASSVKTSIEELKHFLPRYIELVTHFDFPTHSVEITFRRLEPFNKSEWTNEELNLLNIFSFEYFKYCLKTYPLPDHNEIDSIIIMLWQGQFNIDNLLEYWANDNSFESILHFKVLYFQSFEQFNNKMTNPFGEKEIAEKLIKWMNKEETKQNFRLGIEKVILNYNIKDEPMYIEELNFLYDILITDNNAT